MECIVTSPNVMSTSPNVNDIQRTLRNEGCYEPQDTGNCASRKLKSYFNEVYIIDETISGGGM